MRYSTLVLISVSTLHILLSQETQRDNIQEAEPKNGWLEFRKFVYDNLTFPEGGGIFIINGPVTIYFTVKEDGSLTDFFRYESGNALFREEAIRVLKLSPKWTPARKDDTLVSMRMRYDFYFMKPPPEEDNSPVDKISLSLSEIQNDDHFDRLVHFGTYEFDSSNISFYPVIDTNSYHANPKLGFEGFGKHFKETIIMDKSFKSVSTNISVTFEVLGDGSLDNFILNEIPHTNDTAIVRTLLNSGKWDPAYKNGIATKQKIKLDFKYYNGEILETVDVPAIAPENYQNFVTINLFYPYKAMINNISGFVTASFVVEKDGTTTNGKITESLGYGCDEEVLKLITIMPKWTPAFHDGQKVRQRVTERFFFRPY